MRRIAVVGTVWAVAACGSDDRVGVGDRPLPAPDLTTSVSTRPTIVDATVSIPTSTATSTIPVADVSGADTTDDSATPRPSSGPGEGVGVSERITITVSDP